MAMDPMGHLATSLGRVEAKVDAISAELTQLRERIDHLDQEVHNRISEKSEQLVKAQLDIARLETVIAQNRWWIGIAFSTAIVVATLLAKYV